MFHTGSTTEESDDDLDENKVDQESPKEPQVDIFIRDTEVMQGEVTSRLSNDFTFPHSRGSGHYGQVMICIHKFDLNTYAVKRAKLTEEDKTPMEIIALSRLHHKGIVRFHQAWKENYVPTGKSPEKKFLEGTLCYLIQMEYCPRTLNKIWDGKDVEKGKAWELFGQLAEAIAYIHESGYIHCDLKPENILLDKNDNIKVGDFGLVREKDGRRPENVIVVRVKKQTIYRAPDFFNNGVITEKVDIYSLGVLLMELFHKSASEEEESEVRQNYLERKRLPVILEGETRVVLDMLYNMAHQDPALRPSALQVIEALRMRQSGVDMPVVVFVNATQCIVDTAALGLLKAGCKLVINVSPNEDLEFSTEILSYSHQYIPYIGDMWNEQAAASMVERAVEHWGKVDVLITNPGRLFSLLDLARVSVCTKAVIPVMIKNNKGTIIHVEASNIIEALSQASAAQYLSSNIRFKTFFGGIRFGEPADDSSDICGCLKKLVLGPEENNMVM